MNWFTEIVKWVAPVVVDYFAPKEQEQQQQEGMAKLVYDLFKTSLIKWSES